MSSKEREMGNLQSILSSEKHARVEPVVHTAPWGPRLAPALHMGLYNKVVTYFFLYRWVALSTITPS